MPEFRQLLSPASLGAVGIRNRVVMAPMTRSRSLPDGRIPEFAATHFRQRASAGMLITDATMTSPQAVGYPSTPGIWTEEQVEAWRPVVAAVHAAGGRIALQLMHCGRISLRAFQPDGMDPVSSSAVPAASTMLYSPTFTQQPAATPRALDIAEIPGVVAQFATGARHARAAGFDAVEIHGANGYLVDQFLRDGVNQRADRYGGSAENRARFLLEVTEAVAKEVGADRTGVRLSPTNPFNDMADSDPVRTFSTAVRLLAPLHLAWAHLASVGTGDIAHRLRDAYGAPFIINGGMTAERADDAIRSELAVAVSFGSLYIANPDLVERFDAGAPLAQPNPAHFYGGGESGYTDYPATAAV
jgi:N-ethylmaleimide reductase